MKGLKQFGAIALAAAMSVTLIAPLSVNASYGYFDDKDLEIYDHDEHGTYKTDEEGNEYFDRTSYTDTNRVTGDTYTYDEATGKGSGDSDKAHNYRHDLLKKLTIGTNDFGYYHIDLAPGSTLSKKVKITKGKANITLKEYRTSEDTVNPFYDYDAKQYYFRKQDGSKEYVLGEDATYAQRQALRRKEYSYSYRIFGKKPGKAELKFKVKDAAGNQKTYKVKITISDDARVFQSLTYAGKSLHLDMNKGANNDNYYSVQSSNKAGNNYVTKKSGKLRCKMGKDYKFIAAYVIKPNDYTTKTDSGSFGDYSWSESELVRTASRGIDLNGDGDCEDTINGINEKGIGFDDEDQEKAVFMDCNFVKVKNNKKIKLNKVPDKEDYKLTVNDGAASYTRTAKSKGAFAETRIIIVYQNKITKEFSARTTTLLLKVAKK